MIDLSYIMTILRKYVYVAIEITVESQREIMWNIRGTYQMGAVTFSDQSDVWILPHYADWR